MATFINREQDMRYLRQWLESEPDALLFVYGPKSSGKSTLMMKVVEALDEKCYAVNYMNLRGVLIYDFESFLQTFFQKTPQGQVREILSGLTLNIGFFNVSVDDEALLGKNAFKVMEDQLRKAVKKGLRPVIVLDEIQLLKNIELNGKRHLLDELFNLFIRLTKETHLAHVILLTSDSYYIEEIYNHAKLSKTTEFYLLDHLPRSDTEAWLHAEGWDEDQIQTLWEHIGGSPWEIGRILEHVKNGKSVEQACQDRVNDQYGKLKEFHRKRLTDEQRLLADRVHKTLLREKLADANAFGTEIDPLIAKMVAHDFWFYIADRQEIVANSESIRQAMRLMGN